MEAPDPEDRGSNSSRSSNSKSLLSFFLLFLLLQQQLVSAQNESQDVSMLLRMKPALDSGVPVPVLMSWNKANPLCEWQGVQWLQNDSPLNCSSPQNVLNASLWQDPSVSVSSIDLSELQQQTLTGFIPAEIGTLSRLQSLNLSNNSLTGPIPDQLANASSLAFIHLSNNMLNGSIPKSIWNLCSVLTELVLDHNNLVGSIPLAADPSTKCFRLKSLRLNSNNLSGSVPASLYAFAPNLSLLDLKDNILLGGDSTTPESEAATTVVAAAAPAPAAFLARKKSKISAGAVAGIIIGALVGSVLLLSILIAVCTRRESHQLKAALTHSPSLRREIDEAEDATAGKLVAFEGGERFTADQVLNASGEVLGRTNYGTVYKAKLHDGPTIVLRLLRDGTVKDREEFVSAVKELGLIRHRNLVSLRAYYHGPKDEKLLIYDYVQKGNLQDVVHGSTPYAPAPPWVIRHKIALGAARGLAHLHTGLHLPVIHGNLKSKNILVDGNFESHLSDYGLHLLMTTSAANDMLNAQSQQGYRAPELTRIKKANAKSDIYSFGIVLLELLTGRKPGYLTTANGERVEVDLPTLVKTAVLEERTAELFDLDLLRGMRTPAEEGLLQALQLAMGCCAPSPAVRPDIKEVIKQLELIRPKIGNQSPYLHSPFMMTPPDSRSSPRLSLSPLSRPNELSEL